MSKWTSFFYSFISFTRFSCTQGHRRCWSQSHPGPIPPWTSPQVITGPPRKTNNHSHSHSHLRPTYSSRFSSHACLWTVGGSRDTRREPIANVIAKKERNHQKKGLNRRCPSWSSIQNTVVILKCSLNLTSSTAEGVGVENSCEVMCQQLNGKLSCQRQDRVQYAVLNILVAEVVYWYSRDCGWVHLTFRHFSTMDRDLVVSVHAVSEFMSKRHKKHIWN